MTGTLKTFLLMAALTALCGGAGFVLGGAGGMQIALLMAAAMNAFAYWNSDRLVLRMYGARPVDATIAPEFYGIVKRLARKTALPMPKTYIIENDQPNAFATGRNPAHAAVCATTGLLGRLTREELAGVIAHELAHIKNRDTLLMTLTATIAGALSMLSNFAFMLGPARGGEGRRAHPILVLLALILAPIAATLIQLAISRTREYEADRIGAEISGQPRALAAALSKIAGTPILNEIAETNPATAPLFIINPLHRGGIGGLFATHPKTEERIRRLLEMPDAGGGTPFETREESFRWLDDGDTFTPQKNPWS